MVESDNRCSGSRDAEMSAPLIASLRFIMQVSESATSQSLTERIYSGTAFSVHHMGSAR